ncbi:hypothetical protein VNI00_000055 [Paramarasmius palmivorus]|uniref:FAD-binding domain-containing protein n=1 Tax=Paramarasmius palmivorus TaxID=297713 RepID=A0AAW0EGG4_9AGAR
MSLPTRTKYLVVGAGPAGLATSLSLVKHGIDPQDVVVVDARLRGENTSRAMVIHAATLEALDSIGCAQDLAQHGYKGEHFRLQDRSKATILSASFSYLASYTKFPYFLSVPQPVTEHVLEEHVKAAGIRVFRPFKVIGMKASKSGQGLDVSFETNDVLTADIVVGADGSKSVVSSLSFALVESSQELLVLQIRQIAGIDFRDTEGRLESESEEETVQSVVADGTFSELPDGFDKHTMWATVSSGGVNLLVPFTAEDASSLFGTDKVVHRIVFALPSSFAPPPSRPPLEVIQQYLDDYAPFAFSSNASKNEHPIRLSEVYWSSRFRHRSAVADTFFKRLESGAIFLVGDAAHVHSPAGGQGMNLGLRDAISLGSVLAQQSGKSESDLDHALAEHAKSRRERAIKTIGLTKNILNGATGIMESKFYYWGLVLLGYIPAFRNMFVWRLSGLGNR